MKTFVSISVLVAMLCLPLSANDVTTDSLSQSPKEAHFSPKELIFGHILDEHEWHLFTWNNEPVAIPLPVIVYSQHTGLHAFISSKFENEQHAYNQFKMLQEGENKGKIAEVLGDNSEVFPLDLSITKNVFTLLLVTFLMLWLFLSMARHYKKNPLSAPKGSQSLFEPLIVFIRDEVALPSIGPRYEAFMPYLLTAFFFIWFCNMLGLVPVFPGGANLTGNIAVTLVLAVFTFVIILAMSNKHYWKEIFNPDVPWWLKFPIPLIPVIELSQVFIKPFVLMVRLFANITAGHIVPLGFFCLIFIFGEKSIPGGYGVSLFALPFTVFLGLIEVLVVFIQAYVFTLLSAIFIGMAMEEPHSTEHSSK